jgi:hypothetical protein
MFTIFVVLFQSKQPAQSSSARLLGAKPAAAAQARGSQTTKLSARGMTEAKQVNTTAS